ncbi:MAG: BREX system P-loop protein BrxC [Methanocalculus sp. MSAO_Arc2]|uniref:BREX system P-loop protein BrxC n=1 Tax=Methanocalculus sp. MSAO_Arc2 TaxID=2293855 RepID=UPI000FF4CCB6|nr:MAG: BREX system P-loop protein BrxC [Methanocalculus sp. MSAO_Arc2]
MSDHQYILNKEVFHRDPTGYTIPNDGVTKVGRIIDENQLRVARYELESFVCEGSYYNGLKHILESFLDNLDHPVQPAVWVSGFFGSGKSHLVRVLEFLWSDLAFPDGATARDLAKLPPEIKALLIQLNTEGRRNGGIWSAAGTLSAGVGDDPRTAILQIVLRAADLPEKIDVARIHLWLAEYGILEKMRQRLIDAERPRDMGRPFVSNVFAEALIELHPDFSKRTPEEARDDLRRQFGTDIVMTNDLMASMLNDIFAMKSTENGRMPLVLLVLDEVQQYLTIGEGAEQLLAFQGVIEDVCSRFKSRLLIVATGQEALQANTLLQRLQGRFSLRVTLDSKDVDTVLRQTILRKKESMKAPLEETINAVTGEISRHLDGSKLAYHAQDESVLALDYPLLPTRKRFWEKVLHSVDEGGMSTQLRNQLRITFDGTKKYGDATLGTFIPADFIYSQQKTQLVRNNLLPQQMAEAISREDDGTPDGNLRSRICALLFLIQKVDESFGLRATSETLADLLVTDLVTGSENLRREMPSLLSDLHDRGVIAKVGNEYRIQTEEGSVWEGDYQKRKADYKADDSKLVFKRSDLLKHHLQQKLGRISITQGETSTPREIDYTFFSSERPEVGNKIPIWFRHGWEIDNNSVIKEAAAEGSESPLIFVFLPRIEHDALKDEIAGLLAAEKVIEDRPAPTTAEGDQARSNIDAKRAAHIQRIERIIKDIFSQAVVYLGGGVKVENDTLSGSLKKAADSAVIRMYPRFDDADTRGWDQVISRVRSGDQTPLKKVGWERGVDEHPVCKEVLKRLTNPKSGKDLRNALDQPPFGWPKDAIDGALMVLVATDHLKAGISGKPISATDLDRQQIGRATFQAENIVLTQSERLGARSLYTQVGIQSESGREVEQALLFLQHLEDLLKSSGGEEPLPNIVRPGYISELKGYSGNQLVRELVIKQDEIIEDIRRWQKIGEKIQEKLPLWRSLWSLIEHGEGLPELDEILSDAESIHEHRSLLAYPDPVEPLLADLRNGLREAISEGRERIETARSHVLATLEDDSLWQRLSEEDQARLIRSYHLEELPPLKTGTDADIIEELKKRPLKSFDGNVRLIENALASIREKAAKILEPKTVMVPLDTPVTVKTIEDLDEYFAEVRGRVLAELEKGNPVMLK